MAVKGLVWMSWEKVRVPHEDASSFLGCVIFITSCDTPYLSERADPGFPHFLVVASVDKHVNTCIGIYHAHRDFGQNKWRTVKTINIPTVIKTTIATLLSFAIFSLVTLRCSFGRSSLIAEAVSRVAQVSVTSIVELS